jgi:hypothetical protein
MKAVSKVRPKGYYVVDMFRPSTGKVIWEEKFRNLVVGVGLAELLTNGLTSKTQYLGLTTGSPTPHAGDTMSSHSGWVEFHTNYSETVRQTWNRVQTGASATNIADRAEFTLTVANQTTGGVFLCDDDTKNGSTGILYSVSPYETGNRSVNEIGDIIRVTYIADVVDEGA